MDAGQLAAALRDSLGPVTVEAVTRLTGGASRETWSFDAVSADGTRTGLVLRRDPPGRPSEPGAMSREARAIALARAAGLAVPEVLAWTDGPDLWGSAGLVMRRVEGETIARRILRDEAFLQARTVLVDQLGAFAAGLHAIEPPADFPGTDPVADLRATLSTFGEFSPVFELAIARLEADPPPRRRPVTVHGDLRLGNLIVGPDSLQAVIDWELVHAGSPAEDLGWLCVKAWRFGAGPPAAGLGTREELLAAYRAAGGAEISLDELRWWEILGTLRWGVICMTQAQAHLSGAYRSVELAAIGRRVCEQEWDLLLLLEPGRGRGGRCPAPAAGRCATASSGAVRPADGQRAARCGQGVPHRRGAAGHQRAAGLSCSCRGQCSGHCRQGAGAWPASGAGRSRRQRGGQAGRRQSEVFRDEEPK